MRGPLALALAGLALWAPALSGAPTLQLVETFPVETALDHPEIPDAHRVWLSMIAGARHTLDFAEFYASDSTGSRLTEIISAIEAAADRGVRVRFLAAQSFYSTYPATLDRLAAHAGITLRLFDLTPLAGGVLHAKYFIVDDREAYLGSQNFDWRALTHIQELGARIAHTAVVQALAAVFGTDWELAGGAAPDYRARTPGGNHAFPVGITTAAGDTLLVTPVFSPRGWLPDETLWDLPRIVGLIDAARDTVRVQLLTYRAVGRRGEYFDTLEAALRRAAARGVSVQMLLSHWCRRRHTISGLQSLQALPGISIKLSQIPPASGGFIPFARVIHAKYLVVDGRHAWIGTSNWERDYFHASRNVGLLISGSSLAAALDRFFLTGWRAPFAATVDPCADYPAPRIAR